MSIKNDDNLLEELKEIILQLKSSTEKETTNSKAFEMKVIEEYFSYKKEVLEFNRKEKFYNKYKSLIFLVVLILFIISFGLFDYNEIRFINIETKYFKS
ncbi:hypothetical protein ACOJTA_10775 [Malaciobacter sp. WC5094]